MISDPTGSGSTTLYLVKSVDGSSLKQATLARSERTRERESAVEFYQPYARNRI